MAKLAAYMTADPVGFRIDIIYGNIGDDRQRRLRGRSSGARHRASLYAGAL